jgi:hypothetical protein
MSLAELPESSNEAGGKYIIGITGGSAIGIKNPANELSRFNNMPTHYLGFSMPTFPVDIAAESGGSSKTEYILSMVAAYKINAFFGVQSGMNYMVNQGMSYMTAQSDASPLASSAGAPGSLINVWYTSLDIPLLARFEYKPDDFLLGGFIGPYVSIPMGNALISGYRPGKSADPFGNGASPDADASDFSAKLGGISYGISLGLFVGYKTGPGYLVIDAGYMRDYHAIKARDDLGEVFTRSAINLKIGYEFRF